MKVLIVCQFYYPENFTITKIAEGLVQIGHDVTVLTGKPNYGFDHILEEYKDIKYEEINGVKVHRVNLIPRGKSRLSIIKNYLSFWSNSKKWVRNCKEKYDLVYSMSLSPVTILSAGNLYKKKYKVPHVVHCVDLWPESTLVTHAIKKDSFSYKILYKWSRDLYKQADKVLIGSPSFKEYFDKVLKLRTDNISFVPQPSLRESLDCERKDLGDTFNILYCGNLGRIQLVPLMAESMKYVTNENVRFHVIGMGPLTDKLKELIKEYNLEDKIIYHGPIPSKTAAQYFKGSDVLYVSLSKEGYVGRTIPNKLMMSMAYGKPVLAVLEGDGKDVVISAKGGVVATEDAKDIASKIDYLASLNKEELKKLGDNNQVYYKDNFSSEKVVKLIDSCFKVL